jgi:phosphoribosylformylglycinamidine synthase subunit PurL
VAEAARNLVCVGALPTAVTNNLNFGNPLKPDIYFQMREAVLGMAEACELFETPVTGGNVSLYNETDGKAIYPTPVIGMVGVIDDVSTVVGHAFRSEGDALILLGETREEIGASEYLYRTEGIVAGTPPSVDLMAERRLQHAVLALVQKGLLRSAHDCSEGGLACALAECAVGDSERTLRSGGRAPRAPRTDRALLRGEHGTRYRFMRGGGAGRYAGDGPEPRCHGATAGGWRARRRLPDRGPTRRASESLCKRSQLYQETIPNLMSEDRESTRGDDDADE